MALFDRLRKSYGDGGGSNTTTTARRSSPTAGSGSSSTTYPTSPAAGRGGGFGPGQNRIGAGGGAAAGGIKPNWSAPLSQEGTPNPTTSTSTVAGTRPVASRRRVQVSPGQTPTRSAVEAFPTHYSQEEIALSPVDPGAPASPSVLIMDSSAYAHGEQPAPENRDPENINVVAATGVNQTSNNHVTHDSAMVAPSSVPSRLDPRSNEVVRILEERQRGEEGGGTTGDTTRSSNHPSPTTSSIPTNFEDVLVAQRHQLTNTEKGISGGSTTITPAPSSHPDESHQQQHYYSAEETANTSSLLGLPHQLRRDRELFHLRTVDSKLAKDSNHRVGSPWRHKHQQQTHNSSGAPQKPEDLFDSVVAGTDVEREHIPTKQPEVPFPIVLTKETGAQADNISHSESLAPEDLTAEAALHQLGPKASYLDKMETYQRLKQQETEMLVNLGDRGEISNNQDQTEHQPGQGARPAAAFAFAEERKELDRQRAEIRDKEKRLQQWASQLKDWADQLESREAYLMQEAAAQQENHLRSMAVLAQKEMKIRQQETILKLSAKQPEPPRWQTTAKLGTPRRVEDGMQSSVFGSEGAPTTTLIKSNTNSAIGGTSSASGDNLLGVGKPQHQVLAFGNKYDGMLDDRVKDFTWEDRWQAAMDAAKSERNEAKKR